MKGNGSARRFMIILACFLIAGCQSKAPSEAEIRTAIIATQTAEAEQSAAVATRTPLPPSPTATMTPTEVPSATPVPTPTRPAHPVQVQEDFSQDVGDWLWCEHCEWKGGKLYMGPYPPSGAYLQHFVVCAECGVVTNYKIGVEATFEEGQSERGYGFLLRMTDEYLMTAEITPWQSVAVWKLDFVEGWSLVDVVWTGSVRPGALTNHIEVEVTETGTGKSDMSVTVNGRTVLVVWNQPGDQTVVGLTLYGHATEVYFDNFEFLEYLPYGSPLEFPEPAPQA
jgi:hypothetical protein